MSTYSNNNNNNNNTEEGFSPAAAPPSRWLRPGEVILRVPLAESSTSNEGDGDGESYQPPPPQQQQQKLVDSSFTVAWSVVSSSSCPTPTPPTVHLYSTKAALPGESLGMLFLTNQRLCFVPHYCAGELSLPLADIAMHGISRDSNPNGRPSLLIKVEVDISSTSSLCSCLDSVPCALAHNSLEEAMIPPTPPTPPLPMPANIFANPVDDCPGAAGKQQQQEEEEDNLTRFSALPEFELSFLPEKEQELEGLFGALCEALVVFEQQHPPPPNPEELVEGKVLFLQSEEQLEDALGGNGHGNGNGENSEEENPLKRKFMEWESKWQ